MDEKFRLFATKAASIMGSSWAFVVSVAVILIWACFGPGAHYSDTWQLIINTGTSVITFLMVFLIQSTQNRDARALHLKLDELIRATDTARNKLIDLQNLSNEELDELHADLCLAQKSTTDRIAEIEKSRNNKSL